MTARALASVAAFVLFAAACGGSEPTDSPTPEQNGSTPVDSVTTDHHETGSAPPVRATVAPRIDGLDGAPVPALQVESSEFDEDRFNAGGGRFPPLNDPAIVSAAEADWLTGDSLVLGAIQNGEARAYPVGMMTFHHVSNDVLGGEPYLVTFWIACSSGVGFDPIIDGETLLFRTAGLYNGVFTMLDDATGSVWSHIDGMAVNGEMAGQQLEILPLVTIRWADWLSQHPDTTVTDIDTEYSGRYRDVTALGRSGLRQGFTDTLEEIDTRLPEAELVIGVLAGTASMAFPVEDAGGPEPMQASVDGVPVVILEAEDGSATLAYHRKLTDGRVLEFERQGSIVVDSNTGSVWDSAGLAVEGPLLGVQLTFVTSFFTEWYGWAAFHPDTTIFGVDS